MNINIRGDKIEITTAIKNYVEEKVSKVNKYLKEDNSQARVVLKPVGRKFKVEVTIYYDKFIIRSEEINEEMYAAIDLVSDKLERQIRKNKTKLKKQNTTTKKYFEIEEDNSIEEEDNKIVKRKTLEMKPMSEEEAILELSLLGHDFFIYKDSKTNNINVIYKRKDGDYGIIETN